jgi:hypothetical protein
MYNRFIDPAASSEFEQRSHPLKLNKKKKHLRRHSCSYTKCRYKNVSKNNTHFEHCSTYVLVLVVAEISGQLDIWTWALSCFYCIIKLRNVFKRRMEMSQQDCQEKTKNKNGETNDEGKNVG